MSRPKDYLTRSEGHARELDGETQAATKVGMVIGGAIVYCVMAHDWIWLVLAIPLGVYGAFVPIYLWNWKQQRRRRDP